MWSLHVWSHLSLKHGGGDVPLSTLGRDGSRCRIPKVFLGDDWKSRGAFDLQVLACPFSTLYVLVCVSLKKKKDRSRQFPEYPWVFLLLKGRAHMRGTAGVSFCDTSYLCFQYFATGLSVLRVSSSTAWRYAKQTHQILWIYQLFRGNWWWKRVVWSLLLVPMSGYFTGYLWLRICIAFINSLWPWLMLSWGFPWQASLLGGAHCLGTGLQASCRLKGCLSWCGMRTKREIPAQIWAPPPQAGGTQLS